MICSKIIFLLKLNFYLGKEKALLGNMIQHNWFKLYQLLYWYCAGKNQWQLPILYNSFIKNHLCGLMFSFWSKRILILFMLFDQLPVSIKILSWIQSLWRKGNQNILLILLWTNSLDYWHFFGGLKVGIFISWYYYLSWPMKK